MNTQEMRELCSEMIIAGVKAANPEYLVKKAVKHHNGVLYVKDSAYPLKEYDGVLLFGIGKASVPMASAFHGLEISDGLVLSNTAPDDTRCPVPVRKVEHPYPESVNVDASRELVSKLEGVENALIIFLVSGGGSSMLTLPVTGITINEINDLNRMLVTSGMDIRAINTVRKHLSTVKGGRFAGLCQGKGTLVSLILSDVTGDDPGSIASGPTSSDDTTYGDAVSILKEWSLWNRVSQGIRNHLEAGVRGEFEDTPRKVISINHMIGNNMTALRGMKKFGEERGTPTVILTSGNTGEARYAAQTIMAIAKEIQDTGNPFKPPVALVMGGEMTVKLGDNIPDDALGGPNREFVLSAAMQIDGRKNLVVASADSDGIDGRGKAGAVADGDTIGHRVAYAKRCLEEHRSQDLFDALDDSLEFESMTNVNDLTVIMIGRP